MIIVKQSHEILHMDGLERIEMAGRTCYKSEDKIQSERDCDCPGFDVLAPGMVTGSKDCPKCNGTGRQPATADKFAQMLLKRGHEAMIEHGGATVKFVTNRGVTHEIVRHRLCAFGQESTRYVNYGGDDIAFILPVWFGTRVPLGQPINPNHLRMDPKDRMTADERWMLSMLESEETYGHLLRAGWRPEQAREVLPNSLKTEIVVTANYREWRHIFKLRALGTTGKPHPQMQALMLPVLEAFREALPALFGDLEG